MNVQKDKGCICEAVDPCDYHAVTCVVCAGGCKGHPVDTQNHRAEHVHQLAIDNRPVVTHKQ